MSVGPDPAGPRPDDMRPEEWGAFVAISGGASLSEAGRLVGRQRGTVSGWVTKWRLRWGQDLLREGRRANARPPEQSLFGVIQAGKATQKRWAEVRDLAAGRFGTLSETAMDAALTVIADQLNDPDRRKLLTMADAMFLAKIAELAAKRADVLSDVVDPTRAHMAGLAAGGGGSSGAGLLEGLEAAPGAAGGETLEMLEMVAAGFLHLIHGDGDPGPDLIEVTEARAS